MEKGEFSRNQWFLRSLLKFNVILLAILEIYLQF
jgi:hypothetical protein